MRRSEGVSILELIRRNVNHYFRVTEQPNIEQRKRRSLKTVGKYSSGKSSISVNHDQDLAEIYAEVGS